MFGNDPRLLCLCHAFHLQTKRDVLRDCQPGEQCVVLKHHRACPVRRSNGRAVQRNAAIAGRFEPCHDVEQRGLAATRMTEQTAKLMIVHDKIHVAQRNYIVLTLLQSRESFMDTIHH